MKKTLEERIQAYIDKAQPAIQGQEGDRRTYSIACALYNGFGLSVEETFAWLKVYSRKCQPPWPDDKLRHKAVRASMQQYTEPRGYLIEQNRALTPFRPSYRSEYLPDGPPAKESKPRPLRAAKPITDLACSDASGGLPDPIANPTVLFLQTVFDRAESVSICFHIVRGKDGRPVPSDGGDVYQVSSLIARLQAVSGDPNAVFSPAPEGAYIRINPVTAPGTKDEHVAAYRHCLIEFDKGPLPDQWQLILESGAPCAAVLSSGGKSLHAWIRIDASSKEEYQARRDLVYQYFLAKGADTQNKNPSRFSRLPGMLRNGKAQELLALNIGARSFDAWKSSLFEDDGLPDWDYAPDLEADSFPPRSVVIEGFLKSGLKAVIGSSSKCYKTWSVLDLAVSVTSEVPWLGLNTVKGRVLFINLELTKDSLQRRLRLICAAKKLPPPPNLALWTLRGINRPLDNLVTSLTRRITAFGAFNLIIIDPIYKFLGQGTDENRTGDISHVCSQLDALCASSNAAVLYTHHFSKGNQAAKEPIDRMSGSGIWGRDPDAILLLTKHEEDRAYSVETALRDEPEIPPFVVQWQFPLFHHSSLNPARLKGARGRPKAFNPDDLLEMLEEQDLTTEEWSAKSISALGISRRSFFYLKKQLEVQKRVILQIASDKWTIIRPTNTFHA